MSESIILITEDKSKFGDILSNISVLRRCSSIFDVSINNLKKINFADYDIVIVHADEYSLKELSKNIDTIKRNFSDIQILFFTSNFEPDFIKHYYEKGVYDFININSSIEECEIKILNCLKYVSSKFESNTLLKFINISNGFNPKTSLYTHKALKEAYDYLVENDKFRRGVYIILRLDNSIKTKISMNRLAINLKKNLRKTDVIAQGLGKFYLILPNTTINEAEFVVTKIADSMGNDIKLHSGIVTIRSKLFEQVEKLAGDSLKSAIINDKLFISLGENDSIDSNWLCNSENNKHYKLFQKAFDKKLHNIIEPLFYRFERDFISKLPDVDVNQYANDVECVFSLKNTDNQSELLMQFDGYAKLCMTITHKGLDASENSSLALPINMINEKSISRILNKLYTEFLSATT